MNEQHTPVLMLTRLRILGIAALLLAAGYGYARAPTVKPVAPPSMNLAPIAAAPPPPAKRQPSLTVVADSDGMFRVPVSINGASITAAVDSGASVVALGKQDLARLGLTTHGLIFNRKFSTANGVVHGAALQLPRIQVGPCVLNDVAASIDAGALDTPLLGRTALRQLNVEMNGDTLTLRCTE
jgi:clan AA aspartic protease (TIGR02281 family)